jgi:hypothetical protein
MGQKKLQLERVTLFPIDENVRKSWDLYKPYNITIYFYFVTNGFKIALHMLVLSYEKKSQIVIRVDLGWICVHYILEWSKMVGFHPEA